ncbi:hypothetical protein WP50_09840 [Lactiplantibacillus plantarum]|nr:hypothetical protein WP50_09840 [Lactiplantibacillus plantarum]
MTELVVALMPTPDGPSTLEIYGTVNNGVSKIRGLLGREVGSFSKANYLAIYFGAEIKNLDTFIQAGQFPIRPHGTFGAQTFLEFNRTFGKFFGSNATVILDLPFQNINGLSLGNVYTTFYAFLYDFGYRGVLLILQPSIIYKVKAFRTRK